MKNQKVQLDATLAELNGSAINKCWPSQTDNYQSISYTSGSLFHMISHKVQAARRRNIPGGHGPGANVTVTEVIEIRNKFSKARFELEKQHLIARNVDPNIKSLFHGTSATDPALIAESGVGLDNRRSSGIYYGKGTYTATNFDYSHKYRYKCGVPQGNNGSMLICDVLCGEVKDYNNVTQGTAMTLAPNLPGDSNHQYDSVKGEHDGTTMYVVYGSEHIYPKYIVKYTFSG